jgi:hypothetical protein
MGSPPYPNATAWARDVYRPGESPVREHRRVPRRVRMYWGGLKNLVSGVTTVCHHNPYEPRTFGSTFPVRVLHEFGWAHSVAFSADIASRFRSTPRDWPFILHLAEASDLSGRDEVYALRATGILDDRVVAVHGTGLDARGLALMRQRGASLIACPVSNLFTLGCTLRRSAFTSGLRIALGTDSGLTAHGDLLDALRVARATWKLSAARVYRMVTEHAASVLRLTEGQGALREGGIADLIAIRDSGRPPADALLDLRRVELVVIGGRIRLISDRLAKRAGAPRRFERLRIAGRGCVWVDARIKRLHAAAVAVLGGTLKLAGREVGA